MLENGAAGPAWRGLLLNLRNAGRSRDGGRRPRRQSLELRADSGKHAIKQQATWGISVEMALSAKDFRNDIVMPNLDEYSEGYDLVHRAKNAVAAVDAYAAHIFHEASGANIDPGLFIESPFRRPSGPFCGFGAGALRAMSGGGGHYCGRSPRGGGRSGRAALVRGYPAFAAHDDASPMGVSRLSDAVFWPGATGRPSAAPVSLAREPARTVLRPKRSPASSAAPRSSAVPPPGAPAHAAAAGSSPCRSPWPRRGGRCA